VGCEGCRIELAWFDDEVDASSGRNYVFGPPGMVEPTQAPILDRGIGVDRALTDG
jgi:hypothetical protein